MIKQLSKRWLPISEGAIGTLHSFNEQPKQLSVVPIGGVIKGVFFFPILPFKAVPPPDDVKLNVRSNAPVRPEHRNSCFVLGVKDLLIKEGDNLHQFSLVDIFSACLVKGGECFHEVHVDI